MTDPHTGLWIAFAAMVTAMLAIDLLVAHRRPHAVSVQEAAWWSLAWVTVALAFAAGVWWWRGAETGTAFLTGWLLEKSLSVDNLFVFLTIFTAFKVPARLQPRLLAWGVLGAIAMRGAIIAVGTAAVERFHGLLLVFGIFLVVTAGRMLLAGAETNPREGRLVERVRRRLPEGWANGHGASAGPRRQLPSLLLVIGVIEISDLMFAVDSIPAVFAVTTDPFVVFTSNVFAILGLRSLYFVLAGLAPRIIYLKHALSLVLAVVGGKLIINAWLGRDVVPTSWTLALIVAAVGGAVLFSLARPPSGRRG